MRTKNRYARIPVRQWIHRKIIEPLLHQLKQGVSPRDLGRACAWGVTLAINPLYGTATALCALAGWIFKLNHVAIQIANYLMTPVQIAMIAVWIRAAEAVFRLPQVSLSPVEITRGFFRDPIAFVHEYGTIGAAAAAVWVVAAIPLYWGLRALFTQLFDRIQARRAN